MITDERVSREHLQEVFGRPIGGSPYPGFWSVEVGGEQVSFRLDGLGYGTEGMIAICDSGQYPGGWYSKIVLLGADMWLVELPASSYRLVLRPQPTPDLAAAARVQTLPVVTVCRTPSDQILLGSLYAALIEGMERA